MGASDLLHHLRCAGLTLRLTPEGGLHVSPRSVLNDNDRTAIRAERDALVLALQAEASAPLPPLESGNPRMTPDQGDECHAGGWDDEEVAAFSAREARFARLGRAEDADYLAERLTLRDRQHDDRRLCLECAYRADNGRCLAAARGRLPGADRRLEPVPTILQRCPGFTLAPGLP